MPTSSTLCDGITPSELKRDGLQEIGRQFGMEKHSSISRIVERMKKQMLKDRNLALPDGVCGEQAGQEQTPIEKDLPVIPEMSA